jgi:hypothetical protein
MNRIIKDKMEEIVNLSEKLDSIVPKSFKDYHSDDVIKAVKKVTYK